MSCGGTGWPSRKPWAISQPISSSAAIWALLLDALGDHGQREGSADAEDGFEQVAALAAVVQRRHEAAVDLEDVDRHPLQVREGGVSGAEVVDRDANAEGLDLLQVLAGARARRA